MPEVTIDGLRIHYERIGHGPALLLLHGMYCDSRVWRRQLDELSDEFTVVAWDAPGCGRSSDPPETFGAHEFADCLAAFIVALDLGRPHVLGLSLGSLFALEFYRQHPTVPMSLMLASGYAGWAGSLPPEMVEQRLQRALRDADLPPQQWIPGWIPELLTSSAPPGATDEVTAMVSEFHPVGAKVITRALARADLRDVLPRIAIPTLLLYGDADVRSPLHVATDLHTRIPNSQLAIMPGVGHLSNVDAPVLFNTEVRRFLRSLNP